MVQDHIFQKCVFDLFLIHCWSQIGLFSRHFGFSNGSNCVSMGSKGVKNTCLGIPNGARLLLEKQLFDPAFDPFLVSKPPSFKAFHCLTETGEV